MRTIRTPSIFLPSILKEDERLSAAATALEKALSDLSCAASECLFLPRLDQLPSNVLDVLANQWHVDFYDVAMPDDIKRRLIRNSILDHRIKGTPGAVEKLMREIYMDAHILEWFEYGDKPYFFKILQDVTDGDELTDVATLDRARAVVQETKNARSWLRWFEFLLTLRDKVFPAVELQQFNINQSYHDWYDFRVNNALHDGKRDYGAALWHHDGHYARNGSFNRKGWTYSARHGQLQASDFEQILFTFNLPAILDSFTHSDNVFARIRPAPLRDFVNIHDTYHLTPDVRSEDFIRAAELFDIFRATAFYSDSFHTVERRLSDVNVPFFDFFTVSDAFEIALLHLFIDRISVDEPHLFNINKHLFDNVNAVDRVLVNGGWDAKDVVRSFDRQETFAINQQAIDRNEPFDRTPSLQSVFALNQPFDSPDEHGDFLLHQRVDHRGLHSRNGSISHCGSLSSKGSFLSGDDLLRWQQLKEWVEWNCIDLCPKCASRQRIFKIGNARIGSQTFLISDPQFLTVDVCCDNCGSLVAQYIVNDDSVEVFL